MRLLRGPRVVTAAAFAGATLLGLTMLTPAPAAAATRPDYVYSSMLTAVGLRTQLDSNPEPSQVPDLTDVEAPFSEGQLDSFGTEDASGHVGNLNGLGNVPGLICEATTGSPFDCSNVPTGGVTEFPPPDPLDAHATYPTPAHAVAPTASSTPAQASIGQGPLTGSAGTASADVSLTTTATKATLSNVGVDSVMNIGSITTTSTQTVDGTSLRSHAEASLSGISIGNGLAGAGFVNISSVDTTSDTTSTPTALGTDVTTTQVGGATVLGQPATIDSTGIHVTGGGSVPAAVTNEYQQLLDNDLTASGISIRTVGITRSDDQTGHNVDAGGLLITINSKVSGVPSVNGGLPAGVPCPIEPITGQLPVDACDGVGFSADAAYFGNIELGETGIISNAITNTFGGSLGTVGSVTLPTVPIDSSSDGPQSQTVPGTTPSTTTTTTPVGTPAGTTTPGVTSVPAGSTSVASGGGQLISGTGVSAVTAGAQPSTPLQAGSPVRQVPRAFATVDPLVGSTRRLLYVFPMMILVGIGILAGRLRKVPPRIPGNSS